MRVEVGEHPQSLRCSACEEDVDIASARPRHEIVWRLNGAQFGYDAQGHQLGVPHLALHSPWGDHGPAPTEEIPQ